MWSLLVCASVFAATPEGFRVPSALHESRASGQVATALDTRGAWVVQPAVGGQYAWNAVSVGAQVPMLVADLDHPRAGPGQLRLGFHWHEPARNNVTLATGWEVGLPTWPPAQLPTWGTVAYESLPGADAAFAFLLTWSKSPTVASMSWRAAAGWRWSSLAPSVFMVGRTYPLLELGVAVVVPLDHRFALMIEGELLGDRVPATARATARIDVDRHRIDVGAQIQSVAHTLPAPIARFTRTFP